jgi:hypothetical protein
VNGGPGTSSSGTVGFGSIRQWNRGLWKHPAVESWALEASSSGIVGFGSIQQWSRGLRKHPAVELWALEAGDLPVLTLRSVAGTCAEVG